LRLSAGVGHQEKRMADDEVKQLLRELIALQREQVELIKRGAQSHEEDRKIYLSSDAMYREQLATRPWEKLIRVLTMLGIVVLLGYIITH
jgi:hypothetical protein